MKIKYIGSHRAVDVPLPFGGHVRCERDKTAQVPDSLGKGLLEQTANWKKKGKK